MDNTAKRNGILHAALELIAINGFHGAPMAMIAKRAKVATGSIYLYFENKEALIYELYQRLEEHILRELMRGYPAGQPIRERFIHVTQTFIHYCLNAPLDFRFLEQFHNSPYGAAYRRDQLLGENDQNVVQELLLEAQKEQIIKLLPMMVITALIFGPLLCIVRDHILGFIELDDQTIDRTVDACWDAIRI